jgi:hypothetical protein
VCGFQTGLSYYSHNILYSHGLCVTQNPKQVSRHCVSTQGTVAKHSVSRQAEIRALLWLSAIDPRDRFDEPGAPEGAMS